MKKSLVPIAMVLLALIAIPTQELSACATFMMKCDGKLIYAHNLNAAYQIPGMIFINQPGQFKTATHDKIKHFSK